MIAAVARLQARTESSVTSLWHKNIGVTPFTRHLLGHLDGYHDRGQLLHAMGGAVGERDDPL